MSFVVESHVITCCNKECGISFTVPEWWYRGKRETRSTFYCPNGHGQSFVGELEVDKLRRERDNARQQVARAEQEAMEALALAAEHEKTIKKLNKRAAAGTCPCCQRTFHNMSKHMKTKHPEFVAENVVQLKTGA